MPQKRIIYNTHAVLRLQERGFTRQDVRWLIAEGIRTKADTRQGEQRWSAKGYMGGREANLIFIERQTEIIIVTIQWVE